MAKHAFNNELIEKGLDNTQFAPQLIKAFAALEEGDIRQVAGIAQATLKSDNQVPQAHYLLARVAIQTRQLDIALRGFIRATELDPTVADYWAFLALVHSQTGNMPAAEISVKKALSLNSEKAHVLRPMAHVLSLLGQLEEASGLLNKAVEKSPQVAIYHHALAVNLLGLGNFEGAQNAIEKAIELNPFYAESRWILSSLIKAEDNAMAQEFVSLMNTPNMPDIEKAYLGYAAGKLFEDTQHWQQAFNAFEQGAAAKRRLLNYDRNEACRTFDTIRRVCTNDWLNSKTNVRHDATPIFIVGQPRTGTTLVDRVVSSHSQVHSAGEPVQLAMSLRAISGVRTKEFISAELIEKAKQVSAAELARSYLTGVEKVKGNTPYFIDKFPMNFMLLGFIVKAFPNARIIHVTRNPIDTCFAVYKQLFEEVYPHSYDQTEMAEHYVMYQQLMAHWHAVMPGKIIDIAYEDIVQDNHRSAQKLIKDLGLEWEDDCSAFEKNNTAVTTASAVQVREKVHSSSVGRWKKYEQQLAPTLNILQNAGII